MNPNPKRSTQKEGRKIMKKKEEEEEEEKEGVPRKGTRTNSGRPWLREEVLRGPQRRSLSAEEWSRRDHHRLCGAMKKREKGREKLERRERGG